MTLGVCTDIPDILTIPIIPDIPEISTIPEISIIIQISSRMLFQKGITLYVCYDIPEILNIPDIPEFLLILKLLSKCPTMQNLRVLSSKMAELFQFLKKSKKISHVKIPYRKTDLYTDRQSDLYYPLVADKNAILK